jgi:hypothetical protein
MPYRQFNADASTLLRQYGSRALLLRRGTSERVAVTQEAVANSRALIARIVELEANFVADAVGTGSLWPVY